MDNIDTRIRLKSANSQSRMNQNCCLSSYQLHKVYMNANVQDVTFQASSSSQHYQVHLLTGLKPSNDTIAFWLSIRTSLYSFNARRKIPVSRVRTIYFNPE